MKYIRKFNESANSKYVDMALSDRESYNTFNALRRMWKISDEIIAVVTLIIGDLNDCDDLLQMYDEYESDNSEHPLEDAILDYFRNDEWQIPDFMHDYSPVIDGEYLMKELDKR